MRTLAETIRTHTANHLLNENGLLFGQCVTAVGWIGGTVPELSEAQGIVELPTSDVSNSGIVCGAALAGRRPIYAIRYQGFMAFNGATLLNYAAKSKEMWGVPCPVFVRGIAMEGGMGPVAGGMHHSSVARMPGMPIFAPITPKEWTHTWRWFLRHDVPVYCSEHRRSFSNANEFNDIDTDTGVTIIAIGAARFEADIAIRKLRKKVGTIGLIHAYELKPLRFTRPQIMQIKASQHCLVVDSDYEICGISEHIAYQIKKRYGTDCTVLGIADKTAGFSARHDQVTPSAQQIGRAVTKLFRNHGKPPTTPS